MKRFMLVLALISLISAPAEARRFNHHLGNKHHHPATTIIQKHKHGDSALISVAAGIAGFVIGAATATPASYHSSISYSAPANTQQCFAVISKSTGKVTQRCVSTANGANEVIYVD